MAVSPRNVFRGALIVHPPHVIRPPCGQCLAERGLHDRFQTAEPIRCPASRPERVPPGAAPLSGLLRGGAPPLLDVPIEAMEVRVDLVCRREIAVLVEVKVTSDRLRDDV